MGRSIAWLLLAMALPGVAQAEPAAPSRELLAMTPADFEKSAAVKDDALEVVATITTQPGYQEKHGLLRIVWSDGFLRALVDKHSGAATYQLYQHILYAGRYYRYYQTVNLETPAGPVAAQTIDLDRTEQCARSQWNNGCTRSEDVAVAIDAALLKGIAARYAPGSDAGTWHFRFKAQAGEDFDGLIVPAEAAGLLAAVADYRRAHGLKGG